uniref:Uncharacterized protein n=1 Tax=Peromyscus maniculatus bairdii TaxID=230844 RepID=A0A8C8URJ8_PERMB
MENTRARASPRPHRAQPRPRDTKAGPNPPDVWHSRGLPCLESPRQRATAESRGRSAPSPFRAGSESFKGERAPSPGHPSLNSASGLRPHSSPGPRAGALVPLPRASPEPRKRAARGTMGSAVQPHHALGSRGRPKREPGLQVPPCQAPARPGTHPSSHHDEPCGSYAA